MGDYFVRNGERDRRMVERRIAKVGYFGTERRVGDRRAHERRRASEGGGRDPLTRAFWFVLVAIVLYVIDAQLFDGFYVHWVKSIVSDWGARTQEWSAHIWLN